MANDKVIVKIDGDDSGFQKTLLNIGTTSKKVFGTTIKGITTTSVALGALAVTAVKGYADCEQLVGGIETLFGTKGVKSVEEYAKSVGKSVADVRGEYAALIESQEKVLQNANNAYRSAGLSANKYMETVTSFAASLKQSFADTPEGIAAAGEAADRAVIDMADNANKMGTSMESIQTAYQGFAKQNYTMLDNLKLGYGGTKTEMERLLADAQKLSGVKYDISNLADVYEAIHVIQTEVGITGTTAEEAEHTITGSVNMMKAAWSNLVVGIANDNADLDELVDNFINSLLTVGENIIPVLETALKGIGEFVSQSAGKIVPQIVNGIIAALPKLAKAASDIISAFLKAINDNSKKLAKAAVEIVKTIAQTIIDNIPLIIDAAREIITEFADALSESIPILTPITEIIKLLADSMNVLVPTILGAVVAYKAYSTSVAAATVVQNAFNVAANANPIGLAITAIGALVGVIAGYITTVEKACQQTSALGKEIQKLQEEANSLNESYQKTTEEIHKSAKEKEIEMKAASNLIPRLEELINVTERTETENVELNEIIGQLNSAFPDLELAIDNETGALNRQITTIKKATDAWAKLAKAKAISELLTETEKQIYELEILYDEEFAILEYAQSEQDKIISYYDTYHDYPDGVTQDDSNANITNIKYVAQGLQDISNTLDPLKEKRGKMLEDLAELYSAENDLDQLGLGSADENGNTSPYSSYADATLSNEDRIIESLDKVINKYNSVQNEAEFLYGIWEEIYGEGASLQEKATKKAELLSAKISEQEKIVKVTKEAYKQAKNELGETAETTLELKNSVLEATKELAKMENELEDVSDTLVLVKEETESNVEFIEAKYELWCSATKNTATEEEKLAKKTEYLNSKIAQQGRYVSELEKRYKETVAKYGEASEASRKLELQLYKEKDALADLNNELAEHNRLEQHEIADAAQVYNNFLRDNTEALLKQGITYEEIVKIAADISGWDKVLEHTSNTVKEAVADVDIPLNAEIDREQLSDNMESAAEFAAESFVSSFELEFEDLPEGFFDVGKECAVSFGEGFINELNSVTEKIKDAIISSMQSVYEVAAAYGAGNTTVTNISNTATYNIQPSDRESTQQQLQTISAYQTKNEILRN